MFAVAWLLLLLCATTFAQGAVGSVRIDEKSIASLLEEAKADLELVEWMRTGKSHRQTHGGVVVWKQASANLLEI